MATNVRDLDGLISSARRLDAERNGPIVLPIELQCQLLEELSACLTDLSRMRLYMHALQSALDKKARYREILDDEQFQCVMNGGLSKLKDTELVQLALNPFALWDLHDSIFFEPSEYWSERMLQFDIGAEADVPADHRGAQIASQPSAARWRRLREAGRQEGPPRVEGSLLENVPAAAVARQPDAEVEEMARVLKRRYGTGCLTLDPLSSLALVAANKPLPISSLPQSEILELEGGGTVLCTVFDNFEGKVVVEFSSITQRLNGRRILLTATDEQDKQVLKEFVPLAPDDDGVLSGSFVLSGVLKLQYRHTITFGLEDSLG